MTMMKSKVMKMSFRNVWLILILFYLNLQESIATFGNEFVHIKVHIPTEIEAHKPEHHIAHKPTVVHHYHYRNRKPIKKNPFAKHAGLLESILLTELNQPLSNDHYKYLHNADNIVKHIDEFIVKPEKPKHQYLHNADHIVKHVDEFIVKPEKPKHHVETFKIIEETKPKPIVETFKVIESKIPSHEFDHHNHHDHYTHDDHDEYNYKPTGSIETYKVIDDLFSDYHKHFKDPEISYSLPKKQHVKTVKIIDSHESDNSHYGHHISSHDHKNNFEDHIYNADYNTGSNIHTDTIEIVENNAHHQHSPKYNFGSGKRPHIETLIIKSRPKSNNYHNRKNHHQHHYNDHGYDYATSNSDLEFNVAKSHEDNDRKLHQENYETNPSEDYADEQEDSYIAATSKQSDNHQHHKFHRHRHQNNERLNALYEDEQEPEIDRVGPTQTDAYYPTELSLTEFQQSSRSIASPSTSYDSENKATETYNGFSSYSAPHVQGVDMRTHHHPSSYL